MLAARNQPEDVERRAGDRREAAAILIAAGDPMLSKASSAASARSGVVRAMRPRITRHCSSAIALIASITTAEGPCWRSRSSIGRASFRPIRPRAQASFPRDNMIGVVQQFEQQRNGGG